MDLKTQLAVITEVTAGATDVLVFCVNGLQNVVIIVLFFICGSKSMTTSDVLVYCQSQNVDYGIILLDDGLAGSFTTTRYDCGAAPKLTVC